MSVLAGLLYTEHDEWIKVDGDTVTIGITTHATEALGVPTPPRVQPR